MPNNRPMKHLLTLTALLVSSLAMGQMPYNPDSNGDDLIGATDLISVLGLYNTLMVDSSLTCDYEGTELEDLFIGLVDATLQLDSLYVEYIVYDTVSYYTPGCPDLVFESVVLERSYTLNFFDYLVNNEGIASVHGSLNYLGYTRSFLVTYFPSNNAWSLELTDYEIQQTSTYYRTSYWYSSGTSYQTLPFPEGWILNEDGLQVEFRPTDWVTNCDHFRLIPYWSEVE